MVKWPDILIHVAFAVPAGAGAGAGLQIGFAYGGWPGAVLAVLSGAGGLAAVFYWPLRERLQHAFEWGGRQSQMEWIVPSAMTPTGAVAGWWISKFLL